MSNYLRNTSIEDLIQESMLGLIKTKTGIRSKMQVRNLEYFATFKKEDGVVKISSLFIKKKIIPSFARITNEEIKFSGATKEEFLTFLKDRGARKIKNKHDVLERIWV